MSQISLPRVLPFAKRLISQTVLPGEMVVDATAGNGNDTLFLAEHVGEKGHVYAFDIQQQALDSTANRLDHLMDRTTLILDSHANVDQYVQAPIGGAMFNLGYLPRSEDLSVITKPDSTIEAIHKLLGLLKKDGLMTIAVYDGHEGGAQERDALLAYVKGLYQTEVHVIKYQLVNQPNNPPFLLAIEKLKDFDEPTLAK